MEATAQSHSHEMPTSGSALNGIALSATLHCLTGCAIGEVAGMAIGTALGFSDLGTIALAVSLAFLFGYALTSLPLLRAGLGLGVVVPIALASDTLSIGVMEIVDNAIMLMVPGAMEAGLRSVLFWGSLSFALSIAFVFAVPINRYLIKRGRGHAKVHETGIHGGPPVKVVGVVAALAFLFGSSVLIAELANSGDQPHGGDHAMEEEGGGQPDPVRGLAASAGGLTLEMATTRLPRGERGELRYQIVDQGGAPLRDFEVEHEKRMHLIVVRRDMAGFQHLHPRLDGDGNWSTAIAMDEPGTYRVFADFKSGGENHTLAEDLTVDGDAAQQPLPAPETSARTTDGYTVEVEGDSAIAGRETARSFSVSRDGEPVETEPYLGAGGHLVALREGDMAFLHVHPVEGEEGHNAPPGAVSFATEFPSAGRYRMFLQFKHDGGIHTAAFTEAVAE